MLGASHLVALAVIVASSAALFVWRKQALGCPPVPEGVAVAPGMVPLLGHVPYVTHLHEVYEWQLGIFRALNWRTCAISKLFGPVVLWIVDPTCVEHVLKTNFANYVKGQEHSDRMGILLGSSIFVVDGERWQWLRKTVVGMFSARSLKKHLSTTVPDKMKLLAALLDHAADAHQAIDIQETLNMYTMEVFAQYAFGVDLGCIEGHGGAGATFAHAFDGALQVMVPRWLAPWKLWSFIERLTGRRRILQAHVNTVRGYVGTIVKQHRHLLAHSSPAAATAAAGRAEQAQVNLLSQLMLARGEDGQPLPEEELVDHMIAFIVAGKDTSALALTWTLYELSQHPAWEAAVVDEARAAVAASASGLSYDMLNHLTITKAVFLEALRLHPSVPAAFKTAVNPDVLPDGSPVPAGALVLYSPYVSNRNPNVWGEDAGDFRPSRWLEAANLPSSYEYLSFNAGPRVCPGKHLAELQNVYTLAALLLQYKFAMPPGAQRPTYEPSVLLMVKGGLPMLITRRQPADAAEEGA